MIFGRLKAKPKRPKTRKHKLFLAFLAFIFLFILYNFFIDSRIPSVEKYQVLVPNLPQKLDGFTIVQLSDIHRRSKITDGIIKRAVNLTNSLKPDMIVITGDFVGNNGSWDKNINSKDVRPCLKLLSKLKSKYGTYVVMGNHDYRHGGKGFKGELKEYGFKLLVNENVKIDNQLTLVGIDDLWEGKLDFKKAFEGVSKEDIPIVICHQPRTIDYMPNRRCIVLSGHTHGGQVWVPFIKKLKVPIIGWLNFRTGWLKKGDVNLYVNRGIGTVNPPIRIMSRPEICVVELKRARNDTISIMNMR